jgi:hypothetical protein
MSLNVIRQATGSKRYQRKINEEQSASIMENVPPGNRWGEANNVRSL